MSNGSPDTDKDQLLSGKPPLDAGKELDAKGEKVTPPITDKGELTPKLRELMEKKGFRSPDELVDFAENLERRNTSLRQESGLAIYNMPPPNPQFNRGQNNEPTSYELDIPEDPETLLNDRDTFKKFVNRVQESTAKRVRAEINKERDEEEAHTTWVEVQKLIRKDPQKFERLRPTMLQLHRQYPKAPPSALYEEAESLVERQEQQGIEMLKEKLGLSGVDVDKLRALLGKAQPAMISDSGGTRIGDVSGSPLSQEQKEQKILEGILASDRLIE